MSDDYRVLIAPDARREIRALPRPAALRILRKLLDTETDPRGFRPAPPGKGPVSLISHPEHYALQVGDHQVLYTIEGLQVIVWALIAAIA
ncbi:hypothetical protein LWF15_05695 [Kineosporia rhizophila]|uniref:type II toxin-antitoxin system RelE family toxin n=1 Tax=Kineosporia rhizophila TaxID=84633 RepID=UPI001E4C433C|nr:hypothetical protein [Kineosporia rhizophila]MCE0534996.1 hypothetical protein [Kineosporia rhizophila]